MVVLWQDTELKSVPKQNYGNVYANQGGGFSGLMSNPKIFQCALSTITDIQKISSCWTKYANLLILH